MRVPNPRRRILSVDDESDIGVLVTRLLRADFDVRAVEDGRRALEIIRDSPPDVVLLDIAMPRLDGLKVLDLALRIAPSLNVVMLTGSLKIELVSRALNRGAKAYLTKPFSEEELRGVLGHLLQPPEDDAPPWRVAGDLRPRFAS